MGKGDKGEDKEEGGDLKGECPPSFCNLLILKSPQLGGHSSKKASEAERKRTAGKNYDVPPPVVLRPERIQWVRISATDVNRIVRVFKKSRYETVRKYLDTVLSRLPPEAVVLDDRCVVRGGLRIPLIAPRSGSMKIPLPEESPTPSE